MSQTRKTMRTAQYREALYSNDFKQLTREIFEQLKCCAAKQGHLVHIENVVFRGGANKNSICEFSII